MPKQAEVDEYVSIVERLKAASTSNSRDVMDAFGNRPSQDLLNVFITRNALMDMVDGIKIIQDRILSIYGSPGVEKIRFDVLNLALRTAIKVLEEGMPHTECPCVEEGKAVCSICGGLRWITVAQWWLHSLGSKSDTKATRDEQ